MISEPKSHSRPADRGNLAHPVPAQMTELGGSELQEQCHNYHRMTECLKWLEANFERQPSLAEISHQAGLSEAHFQRLFSRWVGVSPKRYVQVLTLERARQSLDHDHSVLDAALDSGLSGPGRLHDLFVQLSAISPGEYKLRGEGLTVRYGYSPSPFGECLLMSTERGICGLAFTSDASEDTQSRDGVFNALKNGYERARFVADDAGARSLGERIFGPPGQFASSADAPLKVLVRGTQFQLSVWRALLEVPAGTVVSYQTLARRAGHPNAVRAVGSANAVNAVCYLIPCHRVIRKSGAIGGYRWGGARKLAMLSHESARMDLARAA